MVLTEPLAVMAEGRPTAASPGLYLDEHADVFRSTIETIQDEIALGAHLTHAGPRAGGSPRGLSLERPTWNDWVPVAPSPVSFGDRRDPEALAASTLPSITEAFVDAADRAGAAGFDHLQLHMGHGTLLASFLSPVTNRRSDRYGGTLRERLTYPIQVVRAVREAWAGPLGVTIPATDWTEGGLTLTDAFPIADALAEAGADIIAPVCGGTVPAETAHQLVDPRRVSDEIRNEVGVATMAAGHVTAPDEANTLVGTGRADLVTYYGPDPTVDA